jgi:hypothetical protein
MTRTFKLANILRNTTSVRINFEASCFLSSCWNLQDVGLNFGRYLTLNFSIFILRKWKDEDILIKRKFPVLYF